MKVAYLILVHKNPRLLARAIHALSTEDSAFFIHIDKKSRFDNFSHISGRSVFFSEWRIPVHWGEFSFVEATLGLIRQALSSTSKYDYFVLMQGADYPIRSGVYIHKFLDQHDGREFVSMVKVPAPGYPLSKINTLRFTSDKPVRRLITRCLAKLGLATRDYRRHLGDLQPYAGDACWALSREACQYLLQFSVENPHVTSYFRCTFAPEESFFHTILGNSRFRDRMQRSLLYRYWPAPGPHPAVLTSQDVAFFEKEEKVLLDDQFGTGEVLFARKFSDDDLELIDRVDAMIERKDHLSAGAR